MKFILDYRDSEKRVNLMWRGSAVETKLENKFTLHYVMCCLTGKNRSQDSIFKTLLSAAV